jgi:hypothetical protein
LVFPLFAALQANGVSPWLDRHDYPYGRTSLAALRDEVLKCRHVVFLVTEGMLSQSRGWGIVELAWANLLQDNLHEAGGVLQNIILPLFFLPQDHLLLPRTVWQSVRDRGIFHTSADDNPIIWASRQIAGFLNREAIRSFDNLTWLKKDSRARARLSARPGLLDRIKALHPKPVLPS